MNVFRLSHPANDQLIAQIFKQELEHIGGTRLLQGRPNQYIINLIQLPHLRNIIKCYAEILPDCLPQFGHLTSVIGSSYRNIIFPYNRELQLRVSFLHRISLIKMATLFQFSPLRGSILARKPEEFFPKLSIEYRRPGRNSS
jgi:hypothetical protein